ncbi:MAG: tetratricopeptide repeat protein [Gemmatimonadales bacterium]
MAGFTTELLRRRIPQILGAYLVASWAVLEFGDWAVNRYVLSPYLVDFAFALLALMAPSVLLLAWFHGAPGRDSWTRIEKIGIPLNLAVAGLVLFSVFQGRDLGAATTTVVVADEEGNALQRVVPKAEFRRKIAIFPFDNVSADTSLSWMQYGLSLALLLDLRQDTFLEVRNEQHFSERLREAGYETGTGVPLSLKREIAEEQHRDYLLAGTVDRSEGMILVDAELYDVRRGRLLERMTLSESDLMRLVDSLSVQLKRGLEIPAQRIEDTADLPVAELVTAVEPAFRDHVEGYRNLVFGGDWQAALSQFQAAAELDPAFAYAHFGTYMTAVLGNLGPVAKEAIKATVEHEYRLAERDQYAAKVEYYLIARQDPAKALAVAEMHANLFPDDIEARFRLGYLYTVQNDRPAAIREYKRILEVDPSQHDMLQEIGGLFESMGEFEQALDYYGRYLERFPDSERSFRVVGDLYRQLGKQEEARDNFERALVVEPENVEALTALGQLEYAVGRPEEAQARLAEASDAARTPLQRAQVYEALRDLAEWQGRTRQAIQYRAQQMAELEASTFPPLLAIVNRLTSLDLFVQAGQAGAALDSLASIQEALEPPWDLAGSIGEVVVYRELGDAESLARAVERLDRMIQALGFENLRAVSERADGLLMELRGDCARALDRFDEALSLEPTRTEVHTDIGRCERKLGRLDEAAVSLERTLEVRPADPKALLELARVRAESGDREAALERVEAALEVWAQADPGFEPAAEARALHAQLDT